MKIRHGYHEEKKQQDPLQMNCPWDNAGFPICS